MQFDILSTKNIDEKFFIFKAHKKKITCMKFF